MACKLRRPLRAGLSVCAALLLAATALTANALSDGASRDLDASGTSIHVSTADPAIARAIGQISPQQIQHTIESLVKFHNRNTLSSMDKDLPAGQGVSAAADWIEAQFRKYSAACGGCLLVKRDTFTQAAGPRVPQPTIITNVYAVLRGSDPAQASRMDLVTGHYDSRATNVEDTHSFAPGANDDASGVAVSLECARVLSKLKLPATLVFVAVAGEEQGLLGSGHLAKLAKSEGWQLNGVLNNDIVGGNTTPGDKFQDKSAVRVFSEGIPASATPQQAQRIERLGYLSDSPSRELAREIVGVGRTYLSPFHPVLEFRVDRFLRGGDHESFNKQGYAAVRFTEWREDFNHQHQNVRVENGVQYGDLPKFVDYHYVARVAELNAATLATLASAPPAPVHVKVITKNLDNNTALEWQSGAGAPADTHYEIVWRALAAPDWQFSTPAAHYGGRNSDGIYQATLPVSKDNVIFGVRAVNAKGQPSPAVPPLPER